MERLTEILGDGGAPCPVIANCDVLHPWGAFQAKIVGKHWSEVADGIQ
jgi:hypothetical protein